MFCKPKRYFVNIPMLVDDKYSLFIEQFLLNDKFHCMAKDLMRKRYYEMYFTITKIVIFGNLHEIPITHTQKYFLEINRIVLKLTLL